MPKIWMITSGGDWADAGAALVATDTPVNMDELYSLYRDWYQNAYLPEFNAGNKPKYYTFTAWLLETNHAREPKKEEAEEFGNN